MKQNNANILEKDMQHVWHPCSQMKDYETFKPLVIKKAYGSTIELSNGSKLIDAISSWWCKSLGHNHPKLKQAMIEQMEQFEHVILANTTNETIVKLSAKLAELCNPLNKVFYAGDGSCAVEVALKMNLQYRINTNQAKKTKFIALENGYHGETALTLAVSDLGLYKHPFKAVMPDVHMLKGIPYVSGKQDTIWHDCSDFWPHIEQQLEKFKSDATAIILEPIVQGAGSMKIYSADFLKRIRTWSKENNIHLIADEIMTGIGRTGTMLASEHADITPDFVCLSKGLTSGWLAFSAVLTSEHIYQAFYADYETNKAFMHSHTYSGNALGASLALASLNTIEEENIIEGSIELENTMLDMFQDIKNQTNKLKNIRNIGGIVAADLCINDNSKRIGYQIYQEATKLGALLRPLGNTIYWLPPLNIEAEQLHKLQNITIKAIKKVLK